MEDERPGFRRGVPRGKSEERLDEIESVAQLLYQVIGTQAEAPRALFGVAAAAGEKFEIVDADERKEAQRAAMLPFTTSDNYFAVDRSELDGLDSAQKIG